ncbi:MAG TPA: hypothetical protein DCS07_14520 [Bdellovibrionales bacterium]|nr:MAG: hypothetical protein A2Z97_04795 [Bdellovibrionales bacterium GWB1_52_6]OFZ05570.1 MAG: hypothetical protein A2X97_11930 [Bdellovibrionales bacterium GWA1_52_35]OFZ41464.1 MAG: hypothetical protein A2070_06505 [Bdellovibrionales bacterium GWC1_52_8]HAR43825.1 hypothetical protein [Bdellovibrionales bacterium]HCM39058.1 hypothetical protein [Bdellovibrionales bacterium]
MRTIPKWWITAFVWVGFITGTEHAIAGVSLLRSGGLVKPVLQATEGFMSIRGGVRVYGAYVRIQNAALRNGAVLSVEHGAGQIKDGILHLQLGAYLTKVEWKSAGGRSHNLTLKWNPERKGVLRDGCDERSPVVTLGDWRSSLNFPIGESCSTRNGLPSVTLSLPGEAEWIESSLFEADGKGERWHLYSIPASVAEGGVIGSISIALRSQKIQLNLVAPKTNVGEYRVKSETFDNALSVGTLGINLSANQITASDSKMFMRYSLLSPNVTGPLRLGLFYQAGAATGGRDSAIEYSEAGFKVLAEFIYAKFDLRAGLLLDFVNFTQSTNATKLQSAQVGPELSLRSRFWRDYRIKAEFSTVFLGASVVSSQSTLYGGVSRRIGFFGKDAWAGLMMGMESFNVKSSNGSTGNFRTQTIHLCLEY